MFDFYQKCEKCNSLCTDESFAETKKRKKDCPLPNRTLCIMKAVPSLWRLQLCPHLFKCPWELFVLVHTVVFMYFRSHFPFWATFRVKVSLIWFPVSSFDYYSKVFKPIGHSSRKWRFYMCSTFNFIWPPLGLYQFCWDIIFCLSLFSILSKDQEF